MSFKQTLTNPFYFLLLMAGLVFSVTACAYGVLIVRGLQTGALPDPAPSGQRMMAWLDQNGFKLMLAELAVLAAFCFLAIATDSFWERRAAARRVRTERV